MRRRAGGPCEPRGDRPTQHWEELFLAFGCGLKLRAVGRGQKAGSGFLGLGWKPWTCTEKTVEAFRMFSKERTRTLSTDRLRVLLKGPIHSPTILTKGFYYYSINVHILAPK